MRDRAVRIVFWLAPVAAFLALYYNGVHTWFQQDDFGWLGLPQEWRSGRPLWDILFTPMAQGTVRPLSERLYFLVLGAKFGMNPLPFHLVGYATFALSLWLLQWIVLRASASRLAALAAPLVWMCSVALVTPLQWVSSYNQLLCGCLMLAALACLVRALESGKTLWWALQGVVFVLSLGALELAVVYPALCAAWVALFARQQWKKTLPFFAIALAYLAYRAAFVETLQAGVYARHWDVSILRTLVRYWGSVVAGVDPAHDWEPATWWFILFFTVVLIGVAVWAWRRGERLAAFGLFWFVVAVGPVLPLRDHLTIYYSSVAAAGVAMAFAAVVARSRQMRWYWQAAALAVIGLHIGQCLPATRVRIDWFIARGERVRVLVEGLERAHQLHPRSMLFLEGIDSDLYWAGLAHGPQRLFGANVALMPGEAKDYIVYPGVRDFTRDVASETVVARTVAWNDGKIYRFGGTILRNVTTRFLAAMPPEWLWTRPRMVDVGQPAFARDIGTGWYPIEGGARWMGKQAVVYLAPIGAGDWDLYVNGIYPNLPGGAAKQTLTVRIGAKIVGEIELSSRNAMFSQVFPLDGVQRTKPLEVVLEVERTTRVPGDERELGVTFGNIGLRSRLTE